MRGRLRLQAGRLVWLAAGLLACVLLACPPTALPAAAAGGVIWRQIGPYGGSVGAITRDPSNPGTLYAGNGHGWVFKSSDGGLRWQRLGGLGAPYPQPSPACLGGINSLRVAPANPDILWATCVGWGPTRSEDGGATWQERDHQYLGWPQDVASDPSDPDRAYLADADNGVYVTKDGGQNWTATGPGHYWVSSLAIDPQAPATLYAATQAGLYKSTDRAGTWHAITNTLPASAATQVTIDPVTPGTVYVAFANAVMKSVDGGASWQATGSELAPGEIVSLEVDPARPATVYAGYFTGELYRSTDGGDHWGVIQLDPDAIGEQNTLGLGYQASPPDPLAPYAVYAGMSYTGVARSSDGGAHWQLANYGMRIDVVNLVGAFAPLPGSAAGSPALLLAQVHGNTSGGLVASSDGGVTWRNAWGQMPSWIVSSLVADPQAASTIYAGTSKPSILKTGDGGLHWTACGSSGAWGFSDVKALAIDPLNPDTMYAGLDDAQLYQSTDGCATWTWRSSGISRFAGVYAIAIDPQHPQRLYAGSEGEGSIYRSDDFGGHWTQVNNGLPDEYVTHYIVVGAPPAGQTQGYGPLYVGNEGSLYVSDDGGNHWSAIGTALQGQQITTLLADPQIPGKLYVSTVKAGVLASTDGGQTFAAMNGGLPTRHILSLALDPQQPGVLYAGTNLFGLYASTTAGDESLYLPVLVRSGP